MSDDKERLARVEEQTKRIPIIEQKLDDLILSSSEKWGKSRFEWGKLVGAVIVINMVLSVAAVAVFGR